MEDLGGLHVDRMDAGALVVDQRLVEYRVDDFGDDVCTCITEL